MSFFGQSFIYDEIPSELYDLRIFGFDTSSPSQGSSGGDAEINEEWLFRRETPYFYGRYYQSSLEFDFTVGSYSYIDGNTRDAIEKWLLGQSSYKTLRIVQTDMTDIVFNVIFTKTTPLYIGNLNYAITLHAKCDRPWGLQIPPTLTRSYTYTTSGVSETINYYNASSFSGYNKPIVTFTTAHAGYPPPTFPPGMTPPGYTPPLPYFSIVNKSDSDREFRFDYLDTLETIVVDNDKGIITSSTGELRMANFNKKFLRLVQGNNELVLTGYITGFSLTTSFAKLIGA